MTRECWLLPGRHAPEVIDGSDISVTVPSVEPTDLLRILIALAVFTLAGWALWKLWAPTRTAEGAGRLKPRTGLRPHPLKRSRAASTAASYSDGLDIGSTAKDMTPDADAASKTLFDPVVLAAETEAWLEQDWFGTGVGATTYDPLPASFVEAAAATPADAAPAELGDAMVNDLVTETDESPDGDAVDTEALADPDAASEPSPWHEAAVAAIPIGRSAKKLERREKAIAARSLARAKKQDERAARGARKAEQALADVLAETATDGLTPFTSLPVKPPTKREVRKAVKTAARAVRSERAADKRTAAAARRADKETRAADKVAAARAAALKLQPVKPEPVTAPADLAWVTAAALAVVAPLSPSPVAPLAWEHAAALSQVNAPTQPSTSAPEPEPAELSRLERIWEAAAEQSVSALQDVSSDPAALVADLWAPRLDTSGLLAPSAVDFSTFDLPEPLPARQDKVAQDNP